MKKDAYISFRTDNKTKSELEAFAKSKKWTLSVLMEDIVQKWLEENAAAKD